MEDSVRSFAVTGMTCASCARIVERSLRKIEGVDFVSVNLATEKAYVSARRPLSDAEIAKAVESVGYGASFERRTEDRIEKDFAAAKRRALLAGGVALPLMVLMIFDMSGLRVPFYAWIELLASAFVVAVPGRRTLKGAWIALRHGHTNMDSLVSLGAFSAFATAILALAGLPLMSFGAIAAMLIGIHLGGRYIEARLKRGAQAEIRALLSLRSEEARLVADGRERLIPIDAVTPGSLVRVLTGERIPLDGEVAEGAGSADESMVSGEPEPSLKTGGAAVTGGTLLVSGTVLVRTTKSGEDGFLAQMIRLVEEAQSSKVPIQAAADRATLVFIPVVFSLALLSGLAWYFLAGPLAPLRMALASVLPWVMGGLPPLSQAIFVFVAVLVIACPCALGLATPMALVAGSGAAAKRGLIIRNGEAIQAAKDIDVVLLDKTGTVTSGRPEVLSSTVPEADLPAVAAMEARSIHPLAVAIASWASARASCASAGENPAGSGPDGAAALPEPLDVNEEAGSGVTALVRGPQGCDARYRIGRPRDAARYEDLMQGARTVVEVERDGEVIGAFALADPVKPDSAGAIADLRAKGLRVVMLTGDAEPTARAVAAASGIDEVIAGIRPAGKAEAVLGFQKQGLKVCMIGDGINDAAALKRADIGMAIGAGADLAIESADVILVRGSLRGALDAMAVSAATFRSIRQNLFWAFFYNLVALPLAMIGALHPAIAEMAMTFSSINVILNSGRVRRALEPWHPEEYMNYKFQVEDMHCGHCKMHIENALKGWGKARSFSVDLPGKTVSVETDAAAPDIVAVIAEAGYTAVQAR
jgi:Cu+-exporting ATPase